MVLLRCVPVVPVVLHPHLVGPLSIMDASRKSEKRLAWTRENSHTDPGWEREDDGRPGSSCVSAGVRTYGTKEAACGLGQANVLSRMKQSLVECYARVRKGRKAWRGEEHLCGCDSARLAKRRKYSTEPGQAEPSEQDAETFHALAAAARVSLHARNEAVPVRCR